MDEQQETPQEPAPEYALVEIFGHRRHCGRILEVERFGTKLLRIDVPTDGDFDKGFVTYQYGGGALFSVTPCDLATVQRVNAPKPWERAGTYRLPAPDDGFDELRDEGAEEDA